MMQVKNRACVRTVAVRSLRASKMRNLIAVIAIMLTTMLFTALFTIAISINDSFQQSNFLMVGGDAHGSFKKLTEEQMETLKKRSAHSGDRCAVVFRNGNRGCISQDTGGSQLYGCA